MTPTLPKHFVAILLVIVLAASFTLAADGLAKTQENVSVVVNLNLANNGKQSKPQAKPQQSPEQQPQQPTEVVQETQETSKSTTQPSHEKLRNVEKISSSVDFELASEKTNDGTLEGTLKQTITPFDERVIAGNLLYFAEDLNAIVEAIPSETSEQKQVKSQLMLIVSNLVGKSKHPGADLLKNTLFAATSQSTSSATSQSGGAQTLDQDGIDSSSETSLESNDNVGHYSNSISSAANYIAGPIAKSLAHIGLGNMSKRAQSLGANLNRFSEQSVATIESTLAKNIAPILKSKSVSEIRGTLQKVESAISSGSGFSALGLNSKIYLPSSIKGVRDYIAKHNNKIKSLVGVKALKEANARLNIYKKVFVNKNLVGQFNKVNKGIKQRAGKKSSVKSSSRSSTKSKKGSSSVNKRPGARSSTGSRVSSGKKGRKASGDALRKSTTSKSSSGKRSSSSSSANRKSSTSKKSSSKQTKKKKN